MDYKSRILQLEQRHSAGDGATLALLLRRSNQGGMAATIAELEHEKGRAFDPSFKERAIRTAAAVRAMVAALFAVAP